MSFIDQKPWTATEENCRSPWSGVANGERFRCYLCGHRFVPGDMVRWVYGGDTCIYVGERKLSPGNFLTCELCDGPDVAQRFAALFAEFMSDRFWVFRSRS